MGFVLPFIIAQWLLFVPWVTTCQDHKLCWSHLIHKFKTPRYLKCCPFHRNNYKRTSSTWGCHENPGREESFQTNEHEWLVITQYTCKGVQSMNYKKSHSSFKTCLFCKCGGCFLESTETNFAFTEAQFNWAKVDPYIPRTSFFKWNNRAGGSKLCIKLICNQNPHY